MSVPVVLKKIDKSIELVATGVTNPSIESSSGGSEVVKIVLDCTSQEQTYVLPDISENKTVIIVKKGTEEMPIRYKAVVEGNVEYMNNGVWGIKNGMIELTPVDGTYKIVSYTGEWHIGGTDFVWDIKLSEKVVNSANKNNTNLPLMSTIPTAGTLPTTTFKDVLNRFNYNDPNYFYTNNTGFDFAKGLDNETDDTANPLLPVLTPFVQFRAASDGFNIVDPSRAYIISAWSETNTGYEWDIELYYIKNGTSVNLVLHCSNDDPASPGDKEIAVLPVGLNGNLITITSEKDDANSQWIIKIYEDKYLRVTDTVPYDIFPPYFHHAYCQIPDDTGMMLEFYQTCSADYSGEFTDIQKKLIYR